MNQPRMSLGQKQKGNLIEVMKLQLRKIIRRSGSEGGVNFQGVEMLTLHPEAVETLSVEDYGGKRIENGWGICVDVQFFQGTPAEETIPLANNLKDEETAEEIIGVIKKHFARKPQPSVIHQECPEEKMDATKCTCDVTDEIWTKDGNWFLYWEVCCLHKTRRYSSSSNFLPLPGACEVSWESITDYTEVDAGAADRAVATMKIVLESARLCKGRDEEDRKKGGRAGSPHGRPSAREWCPQFDGNPDACGYHL